ncbi:MAG TPA: Asp-tRNA(Asn)/Glu-tRNA(Gln) amidotransferase GatCAB subunit B, partial [Sinorhizobium sp.]|nr:Asp-tRNA(Asn)/Glu-tRNA(Gln) amidotransferase GatCAB subunit B [Sinorhizobium sp.]
GRIAQETRLYDPERDETRSLRSKEDAHDYRYFPDPDLLPLEVGEQWAAEIKAALPELPAAKRERFVSQYGLTAYDAAMLTASRDVAAYFEGAVAGADARTAKQCANWISGALSARLNEENRDIAQSEITSVQLRGLVERIVDGTISGKIAREVFDAMWAGEGDADAVIEARGLRQISDSNELDRIVEGVIVANPQQVADYRAGKEKAFNSLVGQVMKVTKGKANPQQVNDILKRRLSS